MPENSPYLPDEDTPPELPSPWGFRIVLIMVALYLVYRFWQGLEWVWEWLVS